jgi:hypothetical protein
VIPDEGTVRSTGIGSWPGTDVTDALKIAFAECPDLPYLPELPARGAHADLIGRGTAAFTGLPVDLQPAGWRLADTSGREHRQALALLRSDLDQLEEQAQGYAGEIKVSFAGPWTMSALVERPKGDRVVADSGARRDLGQALADGLADLVSEMGKRLPEVRFVLQLDEPLLPAVLAGSLPTASGLDRHRAVDRPEIAGAYSYLMERLESAGLVVPLAVHCCAPGAPVDLLRRAGVSRVFLDLDALTGPEEDALAGGLESGLSLGLGALPTTGSWSPDAVARRALRPLRDLGLDAAVASQLIVTPACGLAGMDRNGAIMALRTVRGAAAILSEQLAD